MSDPISMGATSLKTAYDMAKALIDIHGAVKIEAKVLELQRLILDAQEAEATLAAEKRHLEERVRELETWHGEKQRYRRDKIGLHGSWAYGLKSESGAPEDDHKLCAACFEDGHPSTLQPHTIPEGRAEVLMCHRCRSQILTKGVAETRLVARPKPRAGTFRPR